jgi:hypothetical protein
LQLPVLVPSALVSARCRDLFHLPLFVLGSWACPSCLLFIPAALVYSTFLGIPDVLIMLQLPLFIPAAFVYSSCLSLFHLPWYSRCLDLLQQPLFISADFVNTSCLSLFHLPWYSSCLDLLQLSLFIPADFVNTSRICLVKLPWFIPAAFVYSSFLGLF